MKLLKVMLVSAVAFAMAGNILFAEEISATEKKKLEAELKTLKSKLSAARESSVEIMEKRAEELENKLNPPEPLKAEVSLGVDIASAYVFRGSTFNDGLVVQPGIELGGLPVTVGVWANYDINDYDGALIDNQFSEIDIYAGYTLPLPIDPLEVSLGYCEYTYPGAEAEADREIAVCFGLDAPLAPSVAVNFGIDGGIEKTTYIEAGLSHGFELGAVSVELAAALGYVDPDEGEAGVSHVNTSLALSYKLVSVSVTGVSRVDEDVLADVDDGGSYDTGVYGIIGISNTF